MARGALGWTTRQVAAAADVPVSTVQSFETGTNDRAMSLIRCALEKRGVSFLDDQGFGVGVRFKEAEATHDHRKSTGPATDATERMDAKTTANRGEDDTRRSFS